MKILNCWHQFHFCFVWTSPFAVVVLRRNERESNVDSFIFSSPTKALKYRRRFDSLLVNKTLRTFNRGFHVRLRCLKVVGTPIGLSISFLLLCCWTVFGGRISQTSTELKNKRGLFWWKTWTVINNGDVSFKNFLKLARVLESWKVLDKEYDQLLSFPTTQILHFLK